jgi:REP element-mobilizing transposase RayT
MQYRRHRPHWFPENRAVFITWRLVGTIAAAELQRIQRALAQKAPLRFARLDTALDRAQHGPKWLARPEIAQILCDAILRGDEKLGHYELDSYVVMSNHVHMFIWPTLEVPKFMNSLKTHTAKRANLVLGRTGSHFWQDESFDHWCRHEEQHRKIRAYIENNPVKAGLVERPEDWPWSSASELGRPPRRRLPDDALLQRYHP